MHKRLIIIIWSVVLITIVGIALPPYIIHEDYVIYQVFVSALLMGLAFIYMSVQMTDLESINEQISDTLEDSVSDVKANLAYQEQLNSILYEVTTKLNDPLLDDKELLTFILDKAIEAIPDSAYGSVLISADERAFTYAALKGYNYSALKSIRIQREDTYLFRASGGTTDVPIIIHNITEFNQEYMREETYEQLRKAVPFDVQTVISAPIFIDNQLYGILNIDSLLPDAFNENDLNLARFLTTHISFIIKNRQLLQKAYDLSMYDKLTGIYNRTYFEEIFIDFQNRAFTQSKRFSLVIVDLNYLKKINDTYGHIVGDAALRTFTEEVRKHLSATDVFARFGGDEFIVILDNTTSEMAQQKFDAISSHFENVNMDYNGILVPIQFSYGTSEAPAESMILDILVKFADERMYQNKKYLKFRNEEDPRFDTIR